MIRVECWCGQTVTVKEPDCTVTCSSCGFGVKLMKKATICDPKDKTWYEAEAHCEGCGKPMLDVPEPQPYIDVTLCGACGGGKPYCAEQAAAAVGETG